MSTQQKTISSLPGFSLAGPVGGPTPTSTDPPKSFEVSGRIDEISFVYGQIVNGGSISLLPNEGPPDPLPPTPFGGSRGGPHTSSFNPTPLEPITSIQGTVWNYQECGLCLQSVEVYAEGSDEPVIRAPETPMNGQPFRFDVPQGYEFAGVFGRAARYTDAFGVILRSLPRVTMAIEDQAVVLGQPDGSPFAIELMPGEGLILELAPGAVESGTSIHQVTIKNESDETVGEWKATDQGPQTGIDYTLQLWANDKTQLVEVRDIDNVLPGDQHVDTYTVTLESSSGHLYSSDPQIIDKPGG